MQDGKVVDERPATASHARSLVAAMGSVAAHETTRAGRTSPRDAGADRRGPRRDRSAATRPSPPIAARSSVSPALPATARPTCCIQIFDRAAADLARHGREGTGRLRRRRPPVRRHLPALVHRRATSPSRRSRHARAACWSIRGAETPHGRRLAASASASGRRTWTIRSSRSRAATSRRCCSPARSAPMRRSC